MHVSESFKVMNKTGCNVLEKLRPEEFRQARRRIIECVLATDMASHASLLSSLKAKIETFSISKGNNVEKMVIQNDLPKTYENQQAVLGICVHAADISNPAKLFDIYRKWVDFVFLEFYSQGDLEKQMNLPVSYLCDRSTTNINMSQLGFINFIVDPTFEAILQIIPEISPYKDTIRDNLKKFELLVKEEKDKKEKLEKEKFEKENQEKERQEKEKKEKE